MGGGNYLIPNELQTENTSAKSYEIEFFDDIQAKNTYLNNGTKYIVQAFDYNTGLVADWKINTIGSTTEPLKLDGGKKYDIVIYSFNSSKEPPRISDINNRFSYDFSNTTKEFLYHKISEYTPVTGSNELINVKLKNKFSYAKFILDTRGISTYNNKATSISGTPKLQNVHYRSGRINVNNGNFSGDGFRDVNVSLGDKSKKVYESGYIPVAVESGDTSGKFVVEIVAPAQYGDEKKIKNIPVEIKSGTKRTYTIKIKGTAKVAVPKCKDQGADNYGEVGECKFTPKCTDPNAMNRGKAKPCIFPCTTPGATNIGQPLPCKFPPPPPPAPVPKCTDPDATNNGGNLPCVFPPNPHVFIESVSDRILIPCSSSAVGLPSCGPWNSSPEKKFDVHVNIDNYDSSRFYVNYKITDTKNGSWDKSGPQFRTISFNNNATSSWVWKISHYTVSEVSGYVTLEVKVYHKNSKKLASHNNRVFYYCTGLSYPMPTSCRR